MFWEALLDLANDEDRAVLIAESDTVWGCLGLGGSGWSR